MQGEAERLAGGCERGQGLCRGEGCVGEGAGGGCGCADRGSRRDSLAAHFNARTRKPASGLRPRSALCKLRALPQECMYSDNTRDGGEGSFAVIAISAYFSTLHPRPSTDSQMALNLHPGIQSVHSRMVCCSVCTISV